MSVPEVDETASPYRPRGPGAAVLAGSAAVAGLLAIGSLGLGWVQVSEPDLLGGAGSDVTTTLPGRQVAPVVAAVVPAAVALCVVALLLPGRWRLVGLVPASLVALVGAAGSALLLTGRDDTTVTAGPLLGLLLCLLVATLAAAAALQQLRTTTVGSEAVAGPTSGGPPAGVGQVDPDRRLWDALDAGEDPTVAADGDDDAPTR